MLTELNKSNSKSSAKSTTLVKYLKNKSDTLYIYFSEQ